MCAHIGWSPTKAQAQGEEDGTAQVLAAGRELHGVELHSFGEDVLAQIILHDQRHPSEQRVQPIHLLGVPQIDHVQRHYVLVESRRQGRLQWLRRPPLHHPPSRWREGELVGQGT